eukprot:TRINITY_DN14285_c0_g1_i1.p1 TRINITY_DN14285_c0_g1~~TRINITY_DN14285_c0_g1_i1.p1  ORF type:complete len:746 (-),score=128.94 TRINITY_DN14285_c0_g1_i1:173-2410(-)
MIYWDEDEDSNFTGSDSEEGQYSSDESEDIVYSGDDYDVSDSFEDDISDTASDYITSSTQSSSYSESGELYDLIRRKGDVKDVTLDELLQVSGFYDEVIAGNEMSIRCISKQHILGGLFDVVSSATEKKGDKPDPKIDLCYDLLSLQSIWSPKAQNTIFSSYGIQKVFNAFTKDIGDSSPWFVMRLSKLMNNFFINYNLRMKHQLLFQKSQFIVGLCQFLGEPSVKQLILCWVKCGDSEIYSWLVEQGLLEACLSCISRNDSCTSSKGLLPFTLDSSCLMEIIVSFVTLDSFYYETNKGPDLIAALSQMIMPGGTPIYDTDFYFGLEILDSIAEVMSPLPSLIVRTISDYLPVFRDSLLKAPRKAQIKIISLLRNFYSHPRRDYKRAIIKSSIISVILTAFEQSPLCNLLHNQVTQLLCVMLFEDGNLEESDEESWTSSETFTATSVTVVHPCLCETITVVTEDSPSRRSKRKREELDLPETKSMVYHLVKDLELHEFIGRLARVSADSTNASYGGHLYYITDALERHFQTSGVKEVTNTSESFLQYFNDRFQVQKHYYKSALFRSSQSLFNTSCSESDKEARRILEEEEEDDGGSGSGEEEYMMFHSMRRNDDDDTDGGSQNNYHGSASSGSRQQSAYSSENSKTDSGDQSNENSVDSGDSGRRRLNGNNGDNQNHSNFVSSSCDDQSHKNCVGSNCDGQQQYIASGGEGCPLEFYLTIYRKSNPDEWDYDDWDSFASSPEDNA